MEWIASAHMRLRPIPERLQNLVIKYIQDDNQVTLHCDGSEEMEFYDELERGYAADRI